MTITERTLSRVSLAVRLLDDFSGRPFLIGATQVFITGSGREGASSRRALSK